MLGLRHLEEGSTSPFDFSTVIFRAKVVVCCEERTVLRRHLLWCVKASKAINYKSKGVKCPKRLRWTRREPKCQRADLFGCCEAHRLRHSTSYHQIFFAVVRILTAVAHNAPKHMNLKQKLKVITGMVMWSFAAHSHSLTKAHLLFLLVQK